MTPEPQSNDAPVIAQRIPCPDCGSENEEHELDCPESAANNPVHPEYIRGRSHEAQESEAEMSALRAQLKAAQDEARWYSESLRAQLTEATKQREEARAQLLALGVKFNAYSEAVKATHLAWTEGADFNLAKRLVKQAHALS